MTGWTIESIQDDNESLVDRFRLGATLIMTHFIDLTLPAHDPNFPKPRGLLMVPPEVAEQVAEFEDRFVREHGFSIAHEARQRMLDDWTLNYYFDDAYIAYRRTPEGVEILAVGWEEASKYRKEHSPETRRDVRIGTV
jgi:hypothetical protein